MQAKSPWRRESSIAFASAALGFHYDQSSQMHEIANDIRTSHNVKSYLFKEGT